MHVVNNMKQFKKFYEFDMKVVIVDNINIFDIFEREIIEILIIINIKKKVILKFSKIIYFLKLRCNILFLFLFKKIDNFKDC